MRNLEGSGWMSKPDLSIIEAKAGDPALPYTFTLSVMLVNPNAPKDENGDGVPDAPVATPGAATAVPASNSSAQPAAPATTPATPAPATPASGGAAS
jgi:type IV pilus assembly protein PilN